jgi:hypothetical protein
MKQPSDVTTRVVMLKTPLDFQYTPESTSLHILGNNVNCNIDYGGERI